MKAIKTETIHNIDTIKEILENQKLINFAKIGFSDIKANSELQEIAEKFGIKTTDNSIAIMDKAHIKMFITKATITAKRHTSINLSQIAEVIKVIGKDGKIVITDEPNKPVIVTDENEIDYIIVAPLNDEV